MDGIDNDDDGTIDEFSEKEWDFDNWLVSIYPEIGVHVWLDGSWRLTAYGRYLFTTERRLAAGRAVDGVQPMIGGQRHFVMKCLPHGRVAFVALCSYARQSVVFPRSPLRG
jgi:hypothetical protein